MARVQPLYPKTERITELRMWVKAAKRGPPAKEGANPALATVREPYPEPRVKQATGLNQSQSV